MKKVLFLILVCIMTLGTGLATAAPAAADPGDPVVVELQAGSKSGEYWGVGDVTVSDDGINLTVKYETYGGWELVETHLHVAASVEDIPQTKKGNPKIGNFDYKMEHDPPVTVQEYVIPLPPGTPLYIAAHAVVIYPDCDIEETAWAVGQTFPGKSWAMYFTYIPTIDP